MEREKKGGRFVGDFAENKQRGPRGSRKRGKSGTREEVGGKGGGREKGDAVGRRDYFPIIYPPRVHTTDAIAAINIVEESLSL